MRWALPTGNDLNVDRRHFQEKKLTTLNLDLETCTGCLNCEKYCPTKAIRIQSYETKQGFTSQGKERHLGIDNFLVDYSKCTFCDICVRVCEPRSLTWGYNELKPTFRKLDLIVDTIRTSDKVLGVKND